MPSTKIPLYIILLTYVNQAHAHAPQTEAGDDVGDGDGDGDGGDARQGSAAKRVGNEDNVGIR